MGKFANFYKNRPIELEYFLANLENLVISPQLQDQKIYYQLLTKFDFLEDKINHPKFGVEALIRDYDLIDEVTETTLNPQQLKTLKFIQRTLQLSSHILNKDPTQLVGQLWGRLQGFNDPDIEKLLKDAEDSNSNKIWLRPLTPSLITPDSPLIRTLTGHNDEVKAVSVTPDGLKAVSASYDNTLKLWDLETGKKLLTFIGYNSSVTAVSVTPDGLKAVSASDDKTLKLWDLETGKKLLTFTGHNSSVTAVSVTPDGLKAVSASNDNTLKLWDLETGKELLTVTRHNSRVNAVSITPDGLKAVSASYDHTLKLWDVATGKELLTFTGHNDLVYAVSVTPDGLKAVSASNDNTLKVWDLETGRELLTFKGHNDEVKAVSVTPDGLKAVSASYDNTLKLWDLETGREIYTFSGDSPIYCCAVSPDGLTIVAGDSSGKVHFLRLEESNVQSSVISHQSSVERVS